MDPVSLIVVALAAGAAAGAKDVTSQAVKDSYAALKDFVKRRLRHKQAGAEDVVTQFEEDPGRWELPLRTLLSECVSGEDDDLVRHARGLLDIAQQQAGQGKYNVQIGRAQGTVIGDGAQVTQQFGG